MTLVEIENMSAVELRARAAEAIAAAQTAPAADLARRYVQARLDAKRRDDTMQSQGRLIEQYEANLMAAGAALERARQEADVLRRELAQAKAGAGEAVPAAKD